MILIHPRNRQTDDMRLQDRALRYSASRGKNAHNSVLFSVFRCRPSPSGFILLVFVVVVVVVLLLLLVIVGATS